MERHKCKLCFKSFFNGRALGGHMRSHMLNLAISAKLEQEHGREHEVPLEVSRESEFVSSSSSEEDYDEDKGRLYGLRENPKRSMRMVDPEFSSFGVDQAASIVVQDRESETESSKNPTGKRSKRLRKSLEYQYGQENKLGNVKNDQNIIKFTESNSFEPEQVSSVSDTTTEEDVAFCLMMLSRDKRMKKESQNQVQKLSNQSFQEFEEDEEEELEETDESEEYIRTIKNNNNSRSCGTKGKYKCETCKKVFKSYQALGGHRASHKKLKLQSQIQEQESFGQENNAGTSNLVLPEKKVHECPYCYRVFSSGQALGGHKRSHVIGMAARNVATTTLDARVSSKLGDNLSFIDLNLPAPVEDDDLSAVSDAEFVNHNQIRRRLINF